RLLPARAERQFYVLVTSLLLFFFYWQWRPIGSPVIWEAEAGWAVALGWGVFAAGFGLVLLSTLLINHFHLFGLQQSLWQFLGKSIGQPAFRVPFLYERVRHPFYLGWSLSCFGGTVMTAGHLLFAVGMCSCILIAIRY